MMIDPLLNNTVKHSVDLAYYANFVLAKMIRILNRIDADLVAQLQAALTDVDASSFKKDRLDRLLASVRDLNAQAYAALYDGMQQEFRAYTEYEGRFQYDLYKSVVPVSFSVATVVPEQVYAAAMSTPFRGRLLSEWAENLGDRRMAAIKDVIAIGYTEGKTTSDIIREIRGTRAAQYADGLLDVSRREIEPVVRTALSHTAQLTRSRFYEANSDILGDLIWCSTLDNRTSSPCRERDHHKYTNTKEHRPIGHDLSWGSGPGRIHWQCRSSSIALLKGQKELYGARASTGGPVSAKLSYNDWLKDQPASVQDEILGKKRGAAYRESGKAEPGFSNDKGRMLSLEKLAQRDAKTFGK